MHIIVKHHSSSMHGIASVFLMPVLWRIGSPSVSFPELVLIILQLWCSQRHHRCQLSSPCSRVRRCVVCGVSCHRCPVQTQTMVSSGVGQGRDQRFIIALILSYFWRRIIHLKTANTFLSVITIADASVELQREQWASSQYQGCVSRGQMSWDIATIFIARMVHCDLVRAVYWPMGAQQGQSLANGRRAGEAGSQWASSCGSVWSEGSGSAVTASSVQQRSVLVIHIHSPQQ